MKRIALKIDVDTCHGALAGVPALLEALQRHEAQASFFFTLGPDHSGREAREFSPSRYYDFTTRLYGLLLPAPDIGKRGIDNLLRARDAGCEVGIQAWNRVLWEKRCLAADNSWIEIEMARACQRFEEIFGERPLAHAASGWRMNRHALRLTQRLGLCYASDCRGKYPFIPVFDAEIVSCPQIPTTLPTLDELLVRPGDPADQAVDRLLELSSGIRGDHVYTLRAELEGIRYQGALERLLVEWKNRGFQVVALRDLLVSRNLAQLPRHTLSCVGIPGRTGPRMVQGQAFLQP